jgi:hypothetical protein
METALLLLLNLLEASTPPDGSPRPSLDIDAPAILAELAPPPLVASFVAAFAANARGETRVEELLPRLDALATSIAADANKAERVALRASQLQTIAALQKASRDAALSHVALDLATSPLTELVTVWHLHDASSIATSLVCLNSISPADILLCAPGDHFLARRLRLRYRRDQPYPRIELDALSQSGLDTGPIAREHWQQVPSPEHDLRVLSEQERAMGLVRSRLVASPGSIKGAGLELKLEAAPGTQLLQTELLDQHEQVLLRVLRWPPSTLDSF